MEAVYYVVYADAFSMPNAVSLSCKISSGAVPGHSSLDLSSFIASFQVARLSDILLGC
jgi:hypothetical protein